MSDSSPFAPAFVPRPERRFSLARVIGETLSLVRRDAAALVIVTVLLSAGALALDTFLAAMGVLGPVVRPEQGLARTMAGRAAGMLYSSLQITVVLSIALARHDRGARAWDAIGRGFGRLPAMAGVILVINLPLVAASQLLLGSMIAGGEATLAVMGLTMMAVGLVGLVISAFVGQAHAAVVAEGRGVFAAIARSLVLTRGRRWLLFGLTFVIVVTGSIGWTVILQAASAGQDAEILRRLFGLAPLYKTPLSVLTLVFMAALFLELRRLVDPAGDGTAEIFD